MISHHILFALFHMVHLGTVQSPPVDMELMQFSCPLLVLVHFLFVSEQVPLPSGLTVISKVVVVPLESVFEQLDAPPPKLFPGRLFPELELPPKPPPELLPKLELPPNPPPELPPKLLLPPSGQLTIWLQFLHPRGMPLHDPPKLSGKHDPRVPPSLTWQPPLFWQVYLQLPIVWLL